MKPKIPLYISTFYKKIGQTIYENKLISDGDKILVGLSGGKDSLALLETLANRRKYLPFKFELIATHIVITNIGYETDIAFLEQFCLQLDVPLHVKYFEVEMTGEKGPCFICSWSRRKKIFEIARELACNKIAFGHHMDDSIETMLMNLVFHGSISAMPYKLSMFNGDIELIRPLLNMKNEQLVKYADIQQFPKEIKRCPHGDDSKRIRVREFVNSLEEMNKDARINIFRSVNNIYTEYLPIQNNKSHL